MLNTTLESGLKFGIVDDGLSVRGSVALVAEFRELIRHWKPELINVLNGETITDVGQCDYGSSLLGLPTRDGYINRVCPDCGSWFRCLDPYHDWTDSELIELLDERIAIIQHEGQLDRDEPERLACEWLLLMIGAERLSRVVSNARPCDQSTRDILFNFALLPADCIHKGGCRVLEHPTACPPNYLGVE